LKLPSTLAAALVWFGAWLNATGWALSALHQLNAGGYAVSLVLGAAVFGWWQWRSAGKLFPGRTAGKLFRRCRRPLPALFLLVTGLIFLGGALYAPANYDALTYRLPRMLNWLSAGHWHWIATVNERMNYSGLAWEWIALPFLALLRSDRGLFLINALGFALLPGLLFSISRRLGVGRRVAWTWMWLLPLGYGFVTQAGSIGNDLTGAVFGLLALDFGLRARRSGRVSEVWLALLAAALMTGVKLSNLPLALPCLVAVWPALGRLRKHLAGSMVVIVLALAVSAVPLMLLNQSHTGSWNGDPQNEAHMQIKNPVAAVLGNGFLLAEQSLLPPVFPGSVRFNDRLTRALPDSLKAAFPRLRGNKLTELPGEEGAGLGLLLTLPLLLVLAVSLCRLRPVGSSKSLFRRLPPVALAAWVAALVFMAKLGSEAGPRLLLPYYLPVLMPVLLLPLQQEWLRFRVWRLFLFLLALGILPVLVLSMSRPLWPAQSIATRLALAHPGNPTLQRLAATYTAYARRNDVLAPVRAALPDNAREVGFIAGSNDTDYSLWRPFGERTVRYLRPDLRRFLQKPDMEWVVVKQAIWPDLSPVPLETWAAEHHAEIVATLPIVELVSWGPENWWVLHFPPSVDWRPAAGP
jgi:hypothetical protein